MSSRAEYFRRQADVCLRLSLISSTEEVSNRLIVMAQYYNAKAAAIEAENRSLPTLRPSTASRPIARKTS
jgi:hypothetical protein